MSLARQCLPRKSRLPHHCERSEAIHLATEGKNGLLRRFAPRNDGVDDGCLLPNCANASKDTARNTQTRTTNVRSNIRFLRLAAGDALSRSGDPRARSAL